MHMHAPWQQWCHAYWCASSVNPINAPRAPQPHCLRGCMPRQPHCRHQASGHVHCWVLAFGAAAWRRGQHRAAVHVQHEQQPLACINRQRSLQTSSTSRRACSTCPGPWPAACQQHAASLQAICCTTMTRPARAPAAPACPRHASLALARAAHTLQAPAAARMRTHCSTARQLLPHDSLRCRRWVC